MTAAGSRPTGPHRRRPDGEAQVVERPAARKDDRERTSDLEDGAWRTEATFEGGVGQPAGDDRDEDGVDPVVHRGE